LFSKLNIRGSKNIKPPKGLLATIYSAISATQNFNLIKFIWMDERKPHSSNNDQHNHGLVWIHKQLN
jgi:hypothetical protein